MSDTARYLNAMGITPWVLRDLPEELTPVAPVVEPQVGPQTWMVQNCQSPVACVVVAWPDRSLSLDDGSEAAQLLARILQALGVELERFRIAGWVLDQPAPEIEGAPVFCFADLSPPAGADWVALPSLSRMLTEGNAAKGPAWAILKQWMPRLPGA